MRRFVVIGMIAIVGCTREQAEEQAEAWRDCDTAFEALEPPLAPAPSESIVPIDVGDPLPILRITAVPSDAETLANRALATACVLTGGKVSATAELPKWAEQAAEDWYPNAGVFDDPSLEVETRPFASVASSLEVYRKTEAVPRDGIGISAAQSSAEAVLDELVARRLLPSREFLLAHVTEIQERECSEAGCTHFVSGHTFWFQGQVAGIPVRGLEAIIAVSSNGQPRAISLTTTNVEVVSETTAAIEETAAEQRFLDLVQADYPNFEVFLDGPGEVTYLTPFEGGPTEVEPVWYAAWNVRSPAGTIGRPQPTSLSLTDADAPLVPYSPPE